MRYSIISAILMGFVPILNKIGLNSYSPLFAAFLNSFFALIFSIFCIKYKNNNKNILFKPDKNTILLGIFNALGLFTMFIGMKYLNPAISAVAAKSYYFFITVIGIFLFKEKINYNIGILYIVDIIGIALLAFNNKMILDQQSLIGILYIVLSSCLFALSNINAKITKNDSNVTVLWNNLITFIILGFSSRLFVESSEYRFDNGLIYICISAFLGSYLSMLLFYKALKMNDFVPVTLVRGLSPIITICVSLLVFQESISFFQWVGIIVVLICSVKITFLSKEIKQI